MGPGNPGKVQEFRNICPKVLKSGHSSLKIGVIEKFTTELVHLLHHKCCKKYYKNLDLEIGILVLESL
jgi:hypothetical protein